jgi:hypothetical protein
MFDQDALSLMLKECSLDKSLEDGLSGYIEDEYNWHQEHDLALVKNQDGNYCLQLKSST